MILVDTSIWIDHLRKANTRLADLLGEGQVSCHPFILGELACGNLGNRAEILGLLASLPQSPTVQDTEVLAFIDVHRLSGLGLGLIDMHLLASCALGSTDLWTRDRRLAETATRLNMTIL